jgi:hypothetical protein
VVFYGALWVVKAVDDKTSPPTVTLGDERVRV